MRTRTWLAAASTLGLGTAALLLWVRPQPDAGAAPGTSPPPAPMVWIDVGWAGGDAGPAPGPRDGRLGRLDGDESAPEGPMSFTVSPYGELLVLDQVNSRVAVYDPDGAFSHALPLPAQTFQDVEVSEGGTVIVLDRLARRQLLLLHPDGHTLGEVPIEGVGLPEGGAVTAMFLQDDGLWLEVGHQYRVRVLDAHLRPGRRETRPGRPSGAPEVAVGAALDGAGGAAIWLEDETDGMILADRPLFFSRDVARIAWVEADALGRLYVALHLWTFRANDPRQVGHEETALLVLDDWLGRLAELRSPFVATRWEQFRDFKISEDGTIHQLAPSPEGVKVLRWRGSW